MPLHSMRVRIVTKMHGTIDSFDLEKFEVGLVYEVGPSLGNYLLASRYAVPVTDEERAVISPREHVERTSDPNIASEAADKPRKKL